MNRQTVRYVLLRALRVLLFPVIYVAMVVLGLVAVLSVFSMGDMWWVLVVSVALFIFLEWTRRHLPKALCRFEVPLSFGLHLVLWFVPLYYVLTLVLVAYYFAALSYDETWAILLFALPWNWILMPFILLSGGGIVMCTVLPLVAALIKMIGGTVWVFRNTSRSVWRWWPLAGLFAVVVVFVGAIFYVRGVYRSTNFAYGSDAGVARVRDEAGVRSRFGWRDETDLSPFMPFSPSNELVKVESPTASFVGDFPRLHGALALYPVYAAAVEALYPYHGKDEVSSLVKGGTSPEAFSALLYDRADVVFMLEPSAKQFAEARERGKELVVTPLGYEAFVFFVSSVNAVDGLTAEQIRGIYSRRITRWRDVGGDSRRILPFQRPEGSGSQTAMERVMGGVPLTRPVREEFQQSMGGIVNRVADYRNYGNSIGYSFRYYVTSMFKHDGVKILAVDGIEPTRETIQDGTYPFVYPLVAVTAGSDNPNVRALIDWFLSPQGQDLIERVGYVRIGSGDE